MAALAYLRVLYLLIFYHKSICHEIIKREIRTYSNLFTTMILRAAHYIFITYHEIYTEYKLKLY
jgi:hypothetical protein